ncbi:hypothetical protein ACFQYP_29030 [Nonomuraea antimicrobica]
MHAQVLPAGDRPVAGKCSATRSAWRASRQLSQASAGSDRAAPMPAAVPYAPRMVWATSPARWAGASRATGEPGLARTPRGSVQRAATRSCDSRTAMAATGPVTSSETPARSSGSAENRARRPRPRSCLLLASCASSAAALATSGAAAASRASGSSPESSSHR